MKFQRIKHYTIFRHDEAKKTANRNAKDTFQRVKADVILATSEEDSTQIMEVLRLIFRMCTKVV